MNGHRFSLIILYFFSVDQLLKRQFSEKKRNKAIALKEQQQQQLIFRFMKIRL